VAARNTPAEKDIIRCGGGTDRVEADREDIVAPDCEKVFYKFGEIYYGF
jgi:hypothetical protein